MRNNTFKHPTNTGFIVQLPDREREVIILHNNNTIQYICNKELITYVYECIWNSIIVKSVTISNNDNTWRLYPRLVIMEKKLNKIHAKIRKNNKLQSICVVDNWKIHYAQVNVNCATLSQKALIRFSDICIISG